MGKTLPDPKYLIYQNIIFLLVQIITSGCQFRGRIWTHNLSIHTSHRRVRLVKHFQELPASVTIGLHEERVCCPKQLSRSIGHPEFEWGKGPFRLYPKHFPHFGGWSWETKGYYRENNMVSREGESEAWKWYKMPVESNPSKIHQIWAVRGLLNRSCWRFLRIKFSSS